MLKYMKHIYAVHTEKSFSKAADKLFVSQPALSAIIKKVEKEIRLPLFDRNSLPIRLTPAGEYYIQAIEKIAAVEAELQSGLSSLLNENKGVMTIGSSTFFCAHVLPGIIEDFYEDHLGYKVGLLEANVGDLAQCLQAGIIDLCLDTDSLDSSVFSAEVWKEEHIVLAVPASFAVNKQLKKYRLVFSDIASGKFLDPKIPAVDLKHFAAEPFLLLKKGNDMYNRALKMCKDAGFTPKAVMYLDQLLTSYYVACGGKGVTFVRSGVARYVEPTDKLCFYKIDDENAVRNIMLYQKKSTPLSKVAQKFKDFLLSGQAND